ncbi:MAG: hypothetical protein MJ219_01130 [Mycoplasmoidaceae bacterium]|nr:hypothetical protein [Mycoplasmoidaceae bacterium]
MNNAYGAAQAIIDKAASAGVELTLGSTVLVQSIFGSTSQDILNKALIALAVGMSVTCVYGAIRYN